MQVPLHSRFQMQRLPGRDVMAKGQMRSNKEKKKPKQDKNKKKGGAAPSPFGQNPNMSGLAPSSSTNPFGKKS